MTAPDSPLLSATRARRRSLRDRLPGVWILESYVDDRQGEPVGNPFGLNPEGVLIYTEEGFVSAQLMDPARGPVSAAGGVDLSRAAAGYIAYFGRYVLEERDGRITHIARVALLPNLIGVKQRRRITLENGWLTLKTEDRLTSRGVVSSRLVWRRLADQ
jgi:hypothetical protein